MEKAHPSANESDLLTLVRESARDVEELIGQHFNLLRSEVQQQLDRLKAGTASLGAGAGLVTLSGALSALTLAHGLHKATGLPLWSCYGLVAAALGAAGAGLLAAGWKQVGGVRLAPTQTIKALGEDLAWLKKQATAAAT